jgi:hypothetical protein
MLLPFMAIASSRISSTLQAAAAAAAVEEIQLL